MNIIGTESEKNVVAAFIGESQARNRYTYFALQARAEGHEDIAQLFEKMADNEREHAKIWFKILNSGLGTTDTNLINAANGENTEWKSMYPGFAKQARADGFEMLATMFEKVAAIENDHEKRFLEAYLIMNSASGSTKTVREPEKSTVRSEATTHEDAPEKTMHFRCAFCGALSETRLDACPVCEAIGAYEPIR